MNVWEALFAVLRFAVQALLGLLPEWTPFELTGVGAAIAEKGGVFFGLVNWFDYYLPAKPLLLCLTLYLGLHAAHAAWTLTLFVLTKLHILGGSS